MILLYLVILVAGALTLVVAYLNYRLIVLRNALVALREEHRRLGVHASDLLTRCDVMQKRLEMFQQLIKFSASAKALAAAMEPQHPAAEPPEEVLSKFRVRSKPSDQ